jgi:hypothetical protein
MTIQSLRDAATAAAVEAQEAETALRAAQDAAEVSIVLKGKQWQEVLNALKARWMATAKGRDPDDVRLVIEAQLDKAWGSL